MKDVQIKSLIIPEIKAVSFGRYSDNRGYFTEPFRRSDLLEDILLAKENLVQANQSFSHKGVVRGLHFQWNPYMGKFVRTLSGRMVDVIVDIRLGSPTFGKGIMCDLRADHSVNFDKMIWVPPGFAHGNFYTEESMIEYYCTGEYSEDFEICISPLFPDIDWSLCDLDLKAEFDHLVNVEKIISEKDTSGLTISEWTKDERINNFLYENLK